MADPAPHAHLDVRHQVGMERDQIDAERALGERAGRRDLGVEQSGRHGPAGDDAEPAAIGDGGDEIAVGHPGHGAAHDRVLAAEEVGAALP